MPRRSHRRRKTEKGVVPSNVCFARGFFPNMKQVDPKTAEKMVKQDIDQNRSCELIKTVKVLLHTNKRTSALQNLSEGLQLGLAAENHAFERIIDDFFRKKSSQFGLLKVLKSPKDRADFFVERFKEKDPDAREAFNSLFHSSYQRIGFRMREFHGFYTPSRPKWLAKYNPGEFRRVLERWPQLSSKLETFKDFK